MNEGAPSKFDSYAKEIRTMHERDQDMRDRADANNGVIESDENDALDGLNTVRIKEIVKQMGWPTISKVGEDVSDMAWNLVQHADHDVEFQKYCLGLMKAAGEDVKKRRIAYLEDRVRVNEGSPQLYGTQFFDEGINYRPRPIEDPEHIDERRKAMGMETLEEYSKALKDKYNE